MYYDAHYALMHGWNVKMDTRPTISEKCLCELKAWRNRDYRRADVPEMFHFYHLQQL